MQHSWLEVAVANDVEELALTKAEAGKEKSRLRARQRLQLEHLDYQRRAVQNVEQGLAAARERKRLFVPAVRQKMNVVQPC